MGQPLEDDSTEIQITPSDDHHNSRVEKILSQAVNLNESMLMHESTCPICSSSYRAEAEALYFDNNMDWQGVKELIENNEGRTISKDVVENHIRYHTEKGIRELQKMEYIDRIKRLNTKGCSTLERISLLSSILLERIIDVNSITPDGENTSADIAKIKSSETNKLVNSYNSLLKLQAGILGEMKSSGDVVSIPREAFINLFTEAITRKAQTDRERKIIQDLLDNLQDVILSR